MSNTLLMIAPEEIEEVELRRAGYDQQDPQHDPEQTPQSDGQQGAGR